MSDRRLRLGAYALVVRDGQVLLTRLAPRVVDGELWTLPGGGVEHGEDPHDAVLREVREETGLEVTVGERALVSSVHRPDGRDRDGLPLDHHAVRLVYDGVVAPDAAPPSTLEVDGSTAEAAWHPVAAVHDGTVPVTDLVTEMLAGHEPQRHQRVAAYALVRDADRVLLTRFSARGFHTGRWGLPGGGVEHGEHPADAVVREVREETGLAAEVGTLLVVDDVRVRGIAPSGREEDFHSVGVVYAARVERSAEPRVVEVGGTTDAVAWVPVADVLSGAVPAVETVLRALAAEPARPGQTSDD